MAIEDVAVRREVTLPVDRETAWRAITSRAGSPTTSSSNSSRARRVGCATAANRSRRQSKKLCEHRRVVLRWSQQDGPETVVELVLDDVPEGTRLVVVEVPVAELEAVGSPARAEPRARRAWAADAGEPWREPRASQSARSSPRSRTRPAGALSSCSRRILRSPPRASRRSCRSPGRRSASTSRRSSEAGLVRVSHEGRETRYRLTPAPFTGAMQWMVSAGARWDERLARLVATPRLIFGGRTCGPAPAGTCSGRRARTCARPNTDL